MMFAFAGRVEAFPNLVDSGPATASTSLTPASRGSFRWRNDMMKPAKNTICLWYNGDAEEAARFYAKTFPDSSVGAVHRAPGDFPSGKKGDVLTVEFTVMGVPCLGLNGGPAFKHNEAFSFQVATVDQAETDRYWNAIVGNGGQESACGWCKDKWGLSWQITPIALTKAVTDPDPAAAKRAFDAMMTMKKIDIAAIEAAPAVEVASSSRACRKQAGYLPGADVVGVSYGYPESSNPAGRCFRNHRRDLNLGKSGRQALRPQPADDPACWGEAQLSLVLPFTWGKDGVTDVALDSCATPLLLPP